jgi:hypothetical protein
LGTIRFSGNGAGIWWGWARRGDSVEELSEDRGNDRLEMVAESGHLTANDKPDAGGESGGNIVAGLAHLGGGRGDEEARLSASSGSPMAFMPT